jgi:hypothetical protein
VAFICSGVSFERRAMLRFYGLGVGVIRPQITPLTPKYQGEWPASLGGGGAGPPRGWMPTKIAVLLLARLFKIAHPSLFSLRRE